MEWYFVWPMLVFVLVLMALIVIALVVFPVVLVVRRRRDADVEVVPVGSDGRRLGRSDVEDR